VELTYGQDQSDAVLRDPVIAVLIPCRNEEATIGKVVSDFRTALPSACIFVYDNNSTDGTQVEARNAGAVVRAEAQPGKGNVVRRMFADVEADVFVLVDGDDTYDASAAPKLVNRLLSEGLDMINAARLAESAAAYRRGHRFGNALLTGVVARVFGKGLGDMLSGYRVFSRRFVKSFPALSRGFEIETELTVHALELRLPISEMTVRYRERPEGSSSKLRTYVDGMRILKMILRLIKEEKPLPFFFSIFLVLTLSSIFLEIPVVITFLRTGLVPRIPTAVLGTGMVLLGFLALACGFILDTVTRGRIELKRMHYLNVPLRFNPLRSHASAPFAKKLLGGLG
jgi:glycosyltransferase involved in cell wall biosynthesis